MRNGTCQICHRQMTVNAKGEIVRHGHRNRLGVGGGECPGAYHQPLELGRDAIDAVVARMRENAERLAESRPVAARRLQDDIRGLLRRAERAGH